MCTYFADDRGQRNGKQRDVSFKTANNKIK